MDDLNEIYPKNRTQENPAIKNRTDRSILNGQQTYPAKYLS